MLISCRRCAGKGRIARFGHLSNNGACFACEGTGKTVRRPRSAPSAVPFDPSRPLAIIAVDGEDFMRLDTIDPAILADRFFETVSRVGGAVTLRTWNGYRGCYVTERQSWSASKSA